MAEKSKALAKRETSVMSKADQEAIAFLDQAYPVEEGYQSVSFPRLAMVSQDQTEEFKNPKTGKKEIRILREAGTFFTSLQTEEKDEEGKKIWEDNDLGSEIEGIIIYERKQLKFFDGEKYTSSSVYDANDEVIKLFKDKKEVDEGTPEELKSRPMYQGKTAAGKPTSKLEDNRILYVLYEGELHQMNLRGTSMYAYRNYRRQVVPNKVVTVFNSEAKENGATSWNQMTFTPKRKINSKELQQVASITKDIIQGLSERRSHTSQADADEEKAKKDFAGI